MLFVTIFPPNDREELPKHSGASGLSSDLRVHTGTEPRILYKGQNISSGKLPKRIEITLEQNEITTYFMTILLLNELEVNLTEGTNLTWG